MARIVSAGVLLRDARERVLLLRRTGNRAGTWGLPGGRLDAGEGPRKGALREAREEIGALPAVRKVARVDVARGGRGRMRVFVVATRGAWSPTLNHEHDRYVWADAAWLRAHRAQLHPAAKRAVEKAIG